MGCEVTVFSQTENKKELGLKFGADEYIATSDLQVFDGLKRKFDIIINTVCAKIPMDLYLSSLRRDGTLVDVGLSKQGLQLSAFTIALRRVNLAGSLVGGIAETQKMLDLCGEKQIFPEIEVISASYIDEAYERVLKSQVKFRFVIDVSTM